MDGQSVHRPGRRWSGVVVVLVNCLAFLEFPVGRTVGTAVYFASDTEYPDEVAGNIRVALSTGGHRLSQRL